MAELSQETIAIIDRLKAEGDLNRNTGTNSLRSMNIKLDKFDSLFRSINANVIEQTSMLKAQLGVANDAQERARTQEQFDEVTPSPTANQTTDYETSQNEKKKNTNTAINKMGDAISKAMSLKNLAIGAGAGFVGYNLLKGFIDTKYDGAFTEMEEGLGGFGKELKKFSLDGMNDIKTTVTDMNTTLKDLTGPEGSITKLNENITDLSERMREIADLGWLDVAGKLIASISAATATFALTRVIANYMNDDLNKARAKVGGRTWIQRALGLNKDGYLPKGAPPVDPKIVKPSPLSGGQQGANNSDASRVANQNAGKGTTTKLPKAGTGSAGPAGGAKPVSPTVSTAAGNNVPKNTMRADAIGKDVSGKGKITMDNGRLRYIDGPKAGQFVNDKDALKALEASLDSKYSKAFGRIVNLFKIVKIAAAIYLMYEIYVILEDDETYPTQNDKIKAMAPILGQIVGGLGGAAIGAAMGSIPPLTGWGTLIGGIGGGFLGAFMGGYLGEIIAKWAFAEQPKQSDIDKAEVTLKEGYVKPMPSGQSKRGWMRKYGKTHNRDGSPKVKVQLPAGATPGNRAGVTTGGGGGAKKLTPADLLRMEQESNKGSGPGRYTPNEIMLQEMNLGMSTAPGNAAASAKAIELAAANQAGGINVINNNAPHIAPTVVQQGGSELTQISFGGGGGNGKTDSVFQYGLPNSVA